MATAMQPQRIIRGINRDEVGPVRSDRGPGLVAGRSSPPARVIGRRDGVVASMPQPGTSSSPLGFIPNPTRAITHSRPSELEGILGHQFRRGVVPEVLGLRSAASTTFGNSRLTQAKRKYPRVTGPYPAQITVPSTANLFTYSVRARIQWARNITNSLPLPSNPIEGRYRIQNPKGEPFPFHVLVRGGPAIPAAAGEGAPYPPRGPTLHGILRILGRRLARGSGP
jgi:hypothetical protein